MTMTIVEAVQEVTASAPTPTSVALPPSARSTARQGVSTPTPLTTKGRRPMAMVIAVNQPVRSRQFNHEIEPSPNKLLRRQNSDPDVAPPGQAWCRHH